RSAVANGLFANSPWARRISGGFDAPSAAELIGEADVVLGFGVALNMWTTRHAKLLSPSATVIQVDDDADALGAHHRVDIGIVGDVAETARALLQALQRQGAGNGGTGHTEADTSRTRGDCGRPEADAGPADGRSGRAEGR